MNKTSLIINETPSSLSSQQQINNNYNIGLENSAELDLINILMNPASKNKIDLTFVESLNNESLIKQLISCKKNMDFMHERHEETMAHVEKEIEVLRQQNRELQFHLVQNGIQVYGETQVDNSNSQNSQIDKIQEFELREKKYLTEIEELKKIIQKQHHLQTKVDKKQLTPPDSAGLSESVEDAITQEEASAATSLYQLAGLQDFSIAMNPLRIKFKDDLVRKPDFAECEKIIKVMLKKQSNLENEIKTLKSFKSGSLQSSTSSAANSSTKKHHQQKGNDNSSASATDILQQAATTTGPLGSAGRGAFSASKKKLSSSKHASATTAATNDSISKSLTHKPLLRPVSTAAKHKRQQQVDDQEVPCSGATRTQSQDAATGELEAAKSVKPSASGAPILTPMQLPIVRSLRLITSTNADVKSEQYQFEGLQLQIQEQQQCAQGSQQQQTGGQSRPDARTTILPCLPNTLESNQGEKRRKLLQIQKERASKQF